MENNKDFFFDINLINDVIDGTVDEKTATEFFEHLKECSSCRKAYEEALKIKEIMKQDGFLPGTEKLPGDEFTARTMDKIREAKQPALIRIIKLPAVKAALAAAACLIIAVFVFRSDLFGKIEGINGLANDSIGAEDAQNGIEMPAAPLDEPGYDAYGSDYSSTDLPSGYEMSVPESAYYEPGDDDGYQQEVPENTDNRNTSNTKNAADNNYDIDDKTDPDSSGVIVSENTEPPVSYDSSDEPMMEAPAEEAVEDEPAPAPNPPETEVTSSGYSGIHPESPSDPSAVPELPIEEEEPNDPYEFPTDEAEQIQEEPPCTEEELPSCDTATSYAGFAMASPSYQEPLNENDNETALKISSLIADKEVLEGCQKIIACFGDGSEEISWDTINNMYPERFVFIGSTEYDGFKYDAYKCNVYYGENDYVYELFGATAFEVIPGNSVAAEESGTYSYFILIRQ